MIPQFAIIFILLVFYGLKEGSGSCGTCQSNFAICYDAKRFAMCTDGVPDEMFSCPDGYVCTGEPEICLQSTANDPVTSTCEESCGQCRSKGKLFACLSATTYAWCFGADVPDDTAKGVCPSGYICNLESEQVCVLASEVYPSCYEDASSKPSTLSPPTSDTSIGSSDPIIVTTTTIDSTVVSDPSDPTTTTATAPSTSSPSSSKTTISSTTSMITPTTQNPRDESAFCKAMNQGGSFRDENDSSCQQFILCYLLSGEYLGLRYTCTKGTFFDDTTKQCQSERPAGC